MPRGHGSQLLLIGGIFGGRQCRFGFFPPEAIVTEANDDTLLFEGAACSPQSAAGTGVGGLDLCRRWLDLAHVPYASTFSLFGACLDH